MGFWNKLKENPRLAARICWTINLFCFALGAAGLLIRLKILFLAAILLLIVFAFILPKILWRCPYCGEQLPINGMMRIDTCPFCGKKLP